MNENHDSFVLNKDEQIKLLNQFLVDNWELEQLSANLAAFNILKVLKIEKSEIRHSNVLAWLMDPQESHGIGQAFIKRFLSTILLNIQNEKTGLNSAQVELMNLTDVEVRREWRQIDLLVISERNKLALLIENKVKARATKRQLAKYKAVINKEFSGYANIISVLLTKEMGDGIEVADASDYIPWSYVQTLKIIEKIKSQRQDRIPEDANIFLNHYLTTLRRLTMQDDEIVKLCKAIYKKHKDAIDLITQWGATNQFSTAAEEFISEHDDLQQLCLNPRMAWFVNKKWEKVMPPCSNGWKHLSKPYPVACWFRLSAQTSKLGFIIEVGSMEDSKKRLRLIEAFQKEGFKFGKKAFRQESRYTRVHSIYKKIDDPDDTEEIKKHIDEIWAKSANAYGLASKIIQSFKW